MSAEINNSWLENYYRRYDQAFSTQTYGLLLELKQRLINLKSAGGKIIFAGNGASAAISSHLAVDFTKQAGLRAINFADSGLITCFSNDYGYDSWVQKALDFYMDPVDVVILVSCSGESPNIVEAARYTKQAGNSIVTLTGCSNSNQLKQMGDINFWYPSSAYNIVECVHMIWLTTVVDMLVGKAEYPVS